MVKGSHGFYYSALRLMPASTVQDTRAASYGNRYRGVASERLSAAQRGCTFLRESASDQKIVYTPTRAIAHRCYFGRVLT